MYEQVFIEQNVLDDPFEQFKIWYEQAQREVTDEPTAMACATVDDEGQPAVRMVLLKDYDARGFVFYSNFNSHKGAELKSNPRLSLLFWWPPLARQIRIQGTAHPVSSDEADTYFATRPLGSRIGAWASPQSEVIPDRAWLDASYGAVQDAHPDGNIPRPPHWSGYRVVPDTFEFWQGRNDRLHDRFRFVRDGDGWSHSRLAP